MGDSAATTPLLEPQIEQDIWPDEAYPPLTAGAEHAARHGQARFRQLARTEILLIVAVAALVVTFVLAEDRLWTTDGSRWVLVRILMPILLGIAFLAKIANRARDFHGQWFEARSLAETVKSLTWRFITRASPFDGRLDADSAFERAIRESCDQRPSMFSALDESLLAAEQVTSAMRKRRARPLEERRQLYLSARVDDQVRWYSQRSERSKVMSARWFWGGVAVQMLLLIATIVAVRWLTLAPFIGFFATVSSATSALARVNRHDESRRRYASAAQEMRHLRVSIAEAASEADLSEAVEATEQAISREHGVWLARQ
jgi:hypothetical protein